MQQTSNQNINLNEQEFLTGINLKSFGRLKAIIDKLGIQIHWLLFQGTITIIQKKHKFAKIILALYMAKLKKKKSADQFDNSFQKSSTDASRNSFFDEISSVWDVR